MRRIFSTVFGPQEPALTVGSLAIRATRRPSIVAEPGDDAVGAEALLLPVREQPLLGEGAGVDQPLDPLADRQLALLGGLLVVALRAAGEGGLEGLGNRTRGSLGLARRQPSRTRRRRDQSTGPARRTWAPSGRPSTSWAAREASIRRGRSIPVSTPISCSIETTSSLETLPVEPGGTGQPPSSPKLDSKDSTPSSSAASTLARPWPRVLWKWAVSSTPSRRSRAAAKNSWTWRGLAIPVVSPKPTSSQPAAASRSAISKTRSGGTSPS